ncbi:MAG: hypothetical protein SNJ67_13960 [Chloracidobacterium sp.]|uniref:DUF5666 domain-containing protein n=1 Tax=Chloracidobacterium validum TaxID=2821543 RepID=A0ABX8B5H9_9BACT|nr:hypothetical protein [Chloracidobacterium validum]QUW02231.1 hypothetical protein J8C06_07630 [Chloracidobacterium validum]
MHYRSALWLGFLGGALALPSLPLKADTIRLKNGQTVIGKIVRYENRRFVIVYERSSPATQATIALEDIESVEFDGRPLPPGYAGGGRDDQPSNPPEPPRRDPPPARVPPTTTGGLTQTVSVSAREDWTYTQLDVRRGDRIRVSARGIVRLDSRRQSPPDGIADDDPDKLMPGRPTGGLIAVIGDDNNDFIFIGSSREFVAQRSGKLYLSVNEGDLSDNSGSYEARVEVQRNP